MPSDSAHTLAALMVRQLPLAELAAKGEVLMSMLRVMERNPALARLLPPSSTLPSSSPVSTLADPRCVLGSDQGKGQRAC